MLSLVISLILNLTSPQLAEMPEQYLPVRNPDGSIEQTVYFGPERVAGSQSLGPKVSATSALVADKKIGKLLLNKNSAQQQPIASLTKLMTAVVFLETDLDWQAIIEFTRSDYAPGAKLLLQFGEQVRVVDLYRSMLVGSKNNATLMLVRSTNLGQEEFVYRMNQKASELGMVQTSFSEPTGLSEKNVSTAQDYLTLIKVVFNNQEIRQILIQEEHLFETVNTHRVLKVDSTVKLLNSYLQVQAGKTGFTYEAGRCFVTEITNQEGAAIYIVILGSNSMTDVWQETKGLANWAFTNYQL